MNDEDNFTPYMRFAAELAWQGRGKVEPNPMVGAILFNNGKIIGHGWHNEFGGPHAEIEAIEDAKRKGEKIEGSLLIVTLEPCCHKGKTPPCTDALIREKIDGVLFGEWDWNPKVNGKGIKKLKKAGIATMEWSIPETQELYKLYEHNIEENPRPYIHLKVACTPTGEITLERGKKTMLSSPESLKYSHELRAKYDAILVGRGTIEIDNPELTVRHAEGKNPIRIVLDSEQKLSPQAAVFQQPGETLWVTTQPKDLDQPLPPNTRVILVSPQAKNKRIDLNDLMRKLLERNIRKVLVEGGETLSTELIKNRMVDCVSLCITPKAIENNREHAGLPRIFKGAFKAPFELAEARLQNRGPDLWIEGKLSLNLSNDS